MPHSSVLGALETLHEADWASNQDAISVIQAAENKRDDW
jgi:hypothetical protein